ncbi:CBS domain-containing protein [Hymenobacter humi]|uniref:CBS domain-containing protein n=1 Tax=Hymenobacter humi TaxID=1411620 RepID=A0ABW2U4S5_9BACT
MLVSSSSYLITKYFEPYSVYTRKLTARGVDVYANRDRGLLAQLDPRKLLETDFIAVRPTTTLGELVEVFRHATRNLFPVVAAGGRLLGVVSLDSVRNALFDNAHYSTTQVKELMKPAPAVVGPNDDLEHTLSLLDRYGAWALPVCEEDGRYLGFILKSTILARYRRQLILESEA